jgi:hypothetical protein
VGVGHLSIKHAVDYSIMEVGAINVKTNVYTTPSKAIKGEEYKCVDCDQYVVLRKGNVRKHHFAHKTLSKCQYFEHPNESQQHKDAKMKLAQRLRDKFPIEITNNCPKCFAGPAVLDMDKYIYEDNDEVVVEYRDPKNKYIADIAVLNGGKVKTIWEIKHTHETTTNVRPEPWYEITTEDIFENETELLNEGNEENTFIGYSLYCVRTHKNRWCINCRVKEESWALQIPTLSRRGGQEVMWKQEKPCIICKRDQYSPEWIKGPRQVCKVCIATDYQKLKEMFDKPLFLDD